MKLRTHFENKLGEPDPETGLTYDYEGKSEQVTAAVILPKPDEYMEESLIVSLGFSKGRDEQAELGLCVETEIDGAGAGQILGAMRSFFTAHPELTLGDLHEKLPLPHFEKQGIVAATLGNWGLMEEDFPDEDTEGIRLMELIPLYPAEYDRLAKENPHDRQTIVLKSGLNHKNPEREPEKHMVRTAVHSIWEDIIEWYTENGFKPATDLKNALNPEAEPAVFDFLDADLREKLPPSLLASYGMLDKEINVNYFELFCVERMATVYADMNDLLNSGDFDDIHDQTLDDDKITKKWWDRARIPFAMDSGGDFLCIDLNPGTGGTAGQIINHLGDQGPVSTPYHSFFHWLHSYRNDLYFDKYVVHDSGYTIKEAE